MKKLFGILLAVMLLFSSCGDAPAEEKVSIADMYFVYYSQKINAETGNITALCTDPLCSHSLEECQFYHVFGEGFSGDRYQNKIIYSSYYLSRDDDSKSGSPLKQKRALFSYDLLTNLVTKHYDYPASSSGNTTVSYRYYDGFIFLTVMVPPEGVKKPSAEDYTTQTMVIDIEKNSTSYCPVLPMDMYFLDYTGDRIYYADYAHQYHMIDIADGVDSVIEYDRLSEKAKNAEYMYAKLRDVSDDEYGIWKKFADGSHKLIIPGARNLKEVGELILYPMLNPVYDTDYVSGVTYYSLDIWACNPDGSEPRRIFENPGNIKLPYIFSYEAQAAGTSFGIPCYEFVEDANGDMVPLHSSDTDGYKSFFMLDTLTGEYKTVAVRNINDGEVTIPAR